MRDWLIENYRNIRDTRATVASGHSRRRVFSNGALEGFATATDEEVSWWATATKLILAHMTSEERAVVGVKTYP